jgi:5-methylcytosine-specific restriction protein A
MNAMRAVWTIFEDDDSAFLAWMRDNPGSFVLNTRRRRSHPNCVIHRAGCPHLQGIRNAPDRGTLTGAPVVKVVSSSVDALMEYVMTERTALRVLVKRCRSCDAIRADVHVEPTGNERFPDFKQDRHTVVVHMNAYENNPEARAICIAHLGSNCRVCAMDFKRSYGAIGEGYIQVHHVLPEGHPQEGYVLDPIRDLVPVCANCHAMLHRGREKARSVDELRRIMELARKRVLGVDAWTARVERNG